MNRTQRPTETFYFSFFFFPAVNACFFFRGSLPKKTTKQKRSKRRRLRNFRSSGVRGCESSQPNGEKTGLNSWRVQPKTQINNFAATLSTAHWRMYRMRKRKTHSPYREMVRTSEIGHPIAGLFRAANHGDVEIEKGST